VGGWLYFYFIALAVLTDDSLNLQDLIKY